MAASEIAICNLALDAMGARSTISALTEESAEAAACSRQYQPALEATLQAAHWNFARKQATLTLLQDGTLTPPDPVPAPWTFEYAVPSDCLQARYVMGANAGAATLAGSGMGSLSAASQDAPAVRFVVGSDIGSDGTATNVILTNQPDAILVYTYRVANPNLFDSQFTRAFANYLAHLLVMPLSGDKQLGKYCYAIANQICRAAMAVNANQGPTTQNTTPAWIASRGFVLDSVNSNGNRFVLSPSALPAVY